MPLQSVDRLEYLRCTRLFINTDDRDAERSRSNFDVIMQLDQLYEKVAGLELVSWTLPFDVAPTVFSTSIGNVPANNLLDVRVIDSINAIFPDEIFTVSLLSRGFLDAASFATQLEFQIGAAMDDLGHAYFNTTNLTLTITVTDGKLADFALTDGGVRVEMQFLFASGPSAGNTPAVAMGFPEADTVLSPAGPVVVENPMGTLPVQLSPFRYVDLTVGGFNETIARIPLVRSNFISNRFKKHGFRLTKEPIKRLQEVRAVLRMVGDAEPLQVSTAGWDLVMDMLVVAPEVCIPNWVEQKLGY